MKTRFHALESRMRLRATTEANGRHSKLRPVAEFTAPPPAPLRQ